MPTSVVAGPARYVELAAHIGCDPVARQLATSRPNYDARYRRSAAAKLHAGVLLLAEPGHCRAPIIGRAKPTRARKRVADEYYQWKFEDQGCPLEES